MLILEPTLGQKTITIAPRKAYVNTFKARVLSDGGVFEISDCFNLFIGVEYSLKIRRDGDGVEETLSNLYISGTSNYTQVKFEPTIFQEDSTYYIEMTKDSELLYRDKIYVTSQNATERLTNKHEIGNGTLYKTYNPVDDNTYII
tara:strand:- start:204 stop:638 length:435 start_codon:yes stop_codon:yes gene_type:complete